MRHGTFSPRRLDLSFAGALVLALCLLVGGGGGAKIGEIYVGAKLSAGSTGAPTLRAADDGLAARGRWREDVVPAARTGAVFSTVGSLETAQPLQEHLILRKIMSAKRPARRRAA